jgi:predicted component of type VI protein secretion system
MDRFLFLTYDLVSAGKMNIPLQKGVFPDGEDVRTNNEKFFD